MRSKSRTLLSLPQWADSGLMDVWHMAGFCPEYDDCTCDGRTYPEHTWQGKWLSRQEISKAIATAEAMIARELGWWPAPKAIEAEQHDYPVSGLAPGMMATKGDAYKAIAPRWAYPRALGVYAEEAVEAHVPVTYDADFIRYNVTFTVPQLPMPDADWQLYLTADDRRDEPRDEWLIQHTQVRIIEDDGAWQVTLSGDAYWLLGADYRFRRKIRCAPTNKQASYVTQVDVYQRRVVPAQAATLIWFGTGCDGQRCTEQRRPACVDMDGSPRKPLFRVRPAQWQDGQWRPYNVTKPPDKVEFNYIAGASLDGKRMRDEYAQMVFNLSASLLESDAAYCECDRRPHDRLARLRDVEKTRIATYDGAQSAALEYDDKILAQREHLISPWGGRLGAVRAWAAAQSIKERYG